MKLKTRFLLHNVDQKYVYPICVNTAKRPWFLLCKNYQRGFCNMLTLIPSSNLNRLITSMQCLVPIDNRIVSGSIITIACADWYSDCIRQHQNNGQQTVTVLYEYNGLCVLIELLYWYDAAVRTNPDMNLSGTLLELQVDLYLFSESIIIESQGQDIFLHTVEW